MTNDSPIVADARAFIADMPEDWRRSIRMGFVIGAAMGLEPHAAVEAVAQVEQEQAEQDARDREYDNVEGVGQVAYQAVLAVALVDLHDYREGTLNLDEQLAA